MKVAAAYHVPHNAEIEDFDESSKSLEDLMKLEERLPRAKADEVGFLFLKYVTAEKLHEYVEGIVSETIASPPFPLAVVMIEICLAGGYPARDV